MRIALFDYGTGNLHSLAKALERGGAEVRVAADPGAALDGDALVLPGVGAFGAASARLAPAAPALRRAVEDGFPVLGICLGMQLLFDASEEGAGAGLGVVPGVVRRLATARVPHMGWNVVEPVARGGGPDPILAGGALEAYYANGYVAEPADPASIIATTTYDDITFPAAVRRRRAWGVQFHPEKSGADGLDILNRFLEEAGR
jgi:glutamine amidotransferase